MKTILLIEDNIDVLETTQEILELADYKVLAAPNGKIGVELAKNNLPDLIVCDVMMPELDGYGVLNILSKRPETSVIPFIFLTAKADKSDIRKGMNLGADDYITKPFDETELLEAVAVRLAKIEAIQKEYNNDLDGFDSFINTVSGNDALAELAKNRKTKKLKKKETLFHELDHANYLYYIIDGKIKCLKTDEYGKEFVNDIYTNGDFIGHMSILVGEEYQESAIAMENTEVAVIPQQDYINLINNNRDVTARFIKLLAGNVLDREKRLLQLAYSPVRERVADALLTLNKKIDNNQQLRISREDLASIVGTAKESLIRTLSEFKKEGVIETEGQLITIKNISELERAVKGF